MTYMTEETHGDDFFDYKTEPFPDNAIDCEQHKQDLIATIIMLRDQIDAVNNGDATPKHDKWVYASTSFRHIVQKRVNRLNAHIARMKADTKQDAVAYNAAVKKVEMSAAFDFMRNNLPDHLDAFTTAVVTAKEGVK